MKKKLIIIGCILTILIILLSIIIIFSNIYNKSNTDYLDLFPNNISILAVIPSPKKIYQNNPIAFQIIQYIINGNDIITSEQFIDWNNPCGYCKLNDDIECYFLSITDKNKLMKSANFKSSNLYFKNNYCIWNSNSNHSFQLPTATDKTLRHDSNLNKIFSKIGMPNELFIYKKIENETVENIAINFFINDQNTLLCHGCCDIPENSSLKILCNTAQNDDFIFKYIPDDPMIASIFSLNIPEKSEYINEIMQYIFNMSLLHDYYKSNDNKEDRSLLKIFFKDIEELLKFKYKLNVKIDDILQQIQGNAIICVYSPESIQLLNPSKQSKQIDFFSSLIICKLFEKNKLNAILNNLDLEKKIDREGIYLAKEKDKEIYKLIIKNSLENEQCIYFCQEISLVVILHSNDKSLVIWKTFNVSKEK